MISPFRPAGRLSPPPPVPGTKHILGRAPALFLLLMAAGCDGSSDEDMASDRETSKAAWAIVFRIDGAEVRLPLEAMNVFLVDEDARPKRRPIPFEIRGDGVFLAGEIPPALDVGYEGKWERLLGGSLRIMPSGREAAESRLRLPGKAEWRVVDGCLSPQSVKGKWSGSQGNKTLSGKIRLILQDGRAIEGTFATHVVTWG